MPNGYECANELIHVLIGMARVWRQAEPLSSPWDSRIVDGLDIDGILVQEVVGSLLACNGIANPQGNDVTRRVHERKLFDIEKMLEPLDPLGVLLALAGRFFEMSHACEGAGNKHRR